VSDLPTIIPLFPLPNLVLFPGVQVPLHIFEPRYREMVTDVAAGHGIIGMVMLKGEWEREYHGFPDFFEVGCAGKIGGLVKLPDGRFNLVLEGLSEFRVRKEVRERSYRQAYIDWCPVERSALDLEEDLFETLRRMLFDYLGEPARDAWQSLVVQRRLKGADLINFLCFHLDITSIEKQTLLEARESRVDRLIDVLAFKIEERKLGPPGGSQSGGPGAIQ
jgi:uncharacterized protein